MLCKHEGGGSSPPSSTRPTQYLGQRNGRVCTALCAIEGMSTRKDNGAASVYFDHRSGMACQGARYYKGCIGRWLASISMGPDGSGKRVRARLAARTKTELLPIPIRQVNGLTLRWVRVIKIVRPSSDRDTACTDEMNMHRAPCRWTLPVAGCSGSLAQLVNSAIAINWHVAAAQT